MNNAEFEKFSKAMLDMARSLQGFDFTIRRLGQSLRLLNRGPIRAPRRPPLIHNGRKPR